MHAYTARVGQNCLYTPYIAVYSVISLPMYIWFWPTLYTAHYTHTHTHRQWWAIH